MGKCRLEILFYLWDVFVLTCSFSVGVCEHLSSNTSGRLLMPKANRLKFTVRVCQPISPIFLVLYALELHKISLFGTFVCWELSYEYARNKVGTHKPNRQVPGQPSSFTSAGILSSKTGFLLQVHSCFLEIKWILMITWCSCTQRLRISPFVTLVLKFTLFMKHV